MTLNRSIPQPVFSLAETSGPVLGDLPGWKLSDLYPSGDSPEYKGDIEKAAAMATAAAAVPELEMVSTLVIPPAGRVSAPETVACESCAWIQPTS